jgi:hypothetical protein
MLGYLAPGPLIDRIKQVHTALARGCEQHTAVAQHGGTLIVLVDTGWEGDAALCLAGPGVKEGNLPEVSTGTGHGNTPWTGNWGSIILDVWMDPYDASTGIEAVKAGIPSPAPDQEVAASRDRVTIEIASCGRIRWQEDVPLRDTCLEIVALQALVLIEVEDLCLGGSQPAPRVF